MAGKRTRYSADFEAKVALEALRGELTPAQLASKRGIHQALVGDWKRQAMEGLTAVFSGKVAAEEGAKAAEADIEKLHAKIGQLVVGRDFWPKRPLDEPGTATPDDRAGAPPSFGGAAVRAGLDQPVGVLSLARGLSGIPCAAGRLNDTVRPWLA
jgi:transposase